MKRTAAFDLLCACLAPQPDDNLRDRAAAITARGDFAWTEIIKMSGELLVAPALAAGLRRLGIQHTLPADVADYFDALSQLNAARNAEIRVQLLDAVTTLHAAGITPVLLKSAAHLANGNYSSGERILRDLDLLIPAEQLSSAADALERTGYTFRGEEPLAGEQHHQLRCLVRAEDEVPVELHRHLGGAAGRSILSAEHVIASALPLAAMPGARVPDAAHQFLHHVLHAQIQHQARWTGRLSLRRLQDMPLLVRHLNEHDAWEAMFARAKAARLLSVVHEYLYLARRLLQIEVPQPARSLRPRLAHWHLRAALHRPEIQHVPVLLHGIGHTLRQLAGNFKSRRRALNRMFSPRAYYGLHRKCLARIHSVD